MTRDDIIRMAREANPTVQMGEFPEDVALIFERFAALVAAAEREQCAKLVQDNADACGYGSVTQFYLSSNAAAIRARGES